MGMSTHIIGIKPPDEKWRKMKAIYESCVEAGVPVPQPVIGFFDHKEPNELGVEVNIDDAVSKPSDRDYCDEFDVDLSKLPDDVTVIRFLNCY